MNIWKTIIIHNEVYDYEVSSIGLVRSLKTMKLLKGHITSTGYRRVTLYNNDGKRKNFFVHRLVAMMFVPISEKYLNMGLTFDDLVPDHLDYNPLNNEYTNLEWKTLGDNTRSARDLGNFCCGEKSHLSVISEIDALNIINRLLKGERVEHISNDTGISISTIYHIRNKESWVYLTQNIEFPKYGKSKPKTVDESIIHEICRLLEIGEMRQIDIARKLGVKREYVKDIKHRKRRLDISKDYIF